MAKLAGELPKSAPDTRLDKWLWMVRIFKTRAQATVACRADRVTVNGLCAKPSRLLHRQDCVVVRDGLYKRIFRVEASPSSRQGAKTVASYCTDQTPPEEEAARRQRSIEQLLARGRDERRPGGKEKRFLEKFFP